ncbi:AI-2E family transporter [Pseudoglutamicibacter cumminsii]|uniref:AI-2E family transporter n=1 Tax=Pseudoglutamicibacter cumminsii TaxID=156979 RepID=UPI0025561E74|nr:AI-2E family transporter [Pseudoglutamicibacter cumminsii]MDZ3744945.1 AI-2E family transporter [Pseudoglutamicibacter cumminsii]
MNQHETRTHIPAAAQKPAEVSGSTEANTSHGLPTVEGLPNPWKDRWGRAGARSAQVLLIIALASVLIFGLIQVSVLVIPVLLATILACAAWPMVEWLRRRMSDTWAAVVVVVAAVLVLGGIVGGIATTIATQWSGLVDSAVQGFNQARDLANKWGIQFSSGQLDQALEQVKKFLTSSTFSTGAVAGLSSASMFFAGMGTFIVTIAIFLRDGDKIWSFLHSWVPESAQPTWHTAAVRARDTFGGYVRGTAIIAAVDAAGIALVMLVFGVKLWFPLGVIVFVGGFIPIVGALVSSILAALVALVTNGWIPAVAIIIGSIVVNQLEGNLLQPLVMGSALRVHALVVLFALTAGTVLAGIVGALLAVPLTAAAWAVIKVFTGRESKVDDLAYRQRKKRVRKIAKKRAKRVKQLA